MGLNMAQLGLRHALARARGAKLMLERQRKQIEVQLAKQQAALALTVEAIGKVEEDVQSLEDALATVFSDTAAGVEARQTFPKKHITAWGNLTREILAIFRSADGHTLGKSEVLSQLQVRLSLVFETPEKERGFRRQIEMTLRNMFHYGYLERLHDQKTNEEGVWRLKVSSK